MRSALISLGSNMNDPLKQISQACSQLKIQFGEVICSSLYETQPVGIIEQRPFANAACLIETNLDAYTLLRQLQGLESMHGRNRSQEVRMGPRPLDLDIILLGNEITVSETLSIPHPKFRERRFVLEPSTEIAADMIDPLTGESLQTLLNRCLDQNWVKRIERERLQA